MTLPIFSPFLILLLAVSGAAQIQDDPIRFENSNYTIEVSRGSGLLSRFYDKRSRTELITEPRLADNFRLLVPLPDLEGNYILGREQKLTRYEQNPDSLILYWNGPLLNAKDRYDIVVTMTITFVSDAVEVRLALENRGDRSIDEVWYPVLGGGHRSRQTRRDTRDDQFRRGNHEHALVPTLRWEHVGYSLCRSLLVLSEPWTQHALV